MRLFKKKRILNSAILLVRRFRRPGNFYSFVLPYIDFFLQSQYLNTSLFPSSHCNYISNIVTNQSLVYIAFQIFNQLIFKQFCNTSYTIHYSKKIQQIFFQSIKLPYYQWRLKKVSAFFYLCYIKNVTGRKYLESAVKIQKNCCGRWNGRHMRTVLSAADPSFDTINWN